MFPALRKCAVEVNVAALFLHMRTMYTQSLCRNGTASKYTELEQITHKFINTTALLEDYKFNQSMKPHFVLPRKNISYGTWHPMLKNRRYELPPWHVPWSKKYPYARTWVYDNYTITERVEAKIHGMPVPPNKYYLSVLAMFKNEALVMKEWMDHHIAHGVEHFYFVNDHSEDAVDIVLEPYVKYGYITFFPPPPQDAKFRQTAVYKQIMLSILEKNETHWLAIIDLDEFIYSPSTVDIREVLKQHEELSVVGLNWVWFGSNGYEKQPLSVIQSFTRRADYNLGKYVGLTEHYKVLNIPTNYNHDWQKNIINTRHKIHNVEVHTANVEGTMESLSYRRYPRDPPLLLNHYSVQSREFFLQNKGKRGSANNYYAVNARNLEWFQVCDINDIEDTRLADQNRLHNIAQNLVLPPTLPPKSVAEQTNPVRDTSKSKPPSISLLYSLLAYSRLHTLNIYR